MPKLPRPLPLVFSFALASVTLTACTKDEAAKETPSTAEAPAAKEQAPAPAAADDEAHAELPWTDNAWKAALAESKAKGRPVLVDMWAPWCHTCVSMQNTVLRETPILNRKDEFVWLAIDTDRPENADAMAALEVAFWPTFFVVDSDGKPLARHVGSASLEQFMAFLDDGKQAFVGEAAKSPALAALMKADVAATGGDDGGAAALYEQALEAGGPEWTRRFGVRAEYLGALVRSKQTSKCVDYAIANLDDMANARSASTADFVAMAHYCAQQYGAKKAKKFAEAASGENNVIDRVLKDPTADLSYDDRSDALRVLRELHLQLGQEAEAKAVAVRQKAVLDEAVGKASTVELAAGYAWPREEVYMYLGEGEKLIPWLEELTQKLPESYDPPYRLAWLLNELGRPEEALKHAERSGELAYGPRGVRVKWLVAEILEKGKDTDAQRAAWRDVVSAIDGLTDQRRWLPAKAQAEQKLAAIDGKPAKP